MKTNKLRIAYTWHHDHWSCYHNYINLSANKIAETGNNVIHIKSVSLFDQSVWAQNVFENYQIIIERKS